MTPVSRPQEPAPAPALHTAGPHTAAPRAPRTAEPAWYSWLALGLAAVIIVISAMQALPPAPVPASAAATQFSAERAFTHLKEIAQRPHPIGTSENARVREYLAGQLQAMGLQTQFQTADAMYMLPFGIMGGQPTNVIARLPGTQPGGKAVVLMGHFDSVATGPGAADNGTAVVTMLEAARAAKAGAPLKNDLIFLFTDGEEYGLLGARAFYQQHPWAANVGMVLNFEARGSEGASWLFRSSGENGWMVRELARASGDRPLASSFLGGLMTLMPNTTDLQVPMETNIPGFDFAYLGKFETYHTANDSLANVSLRSVQHHGVHAVSLIRAFGNADLVNPPKGHAIYFSLLGRVVHYPMGWWLPLTVLTLVAFAGVIALGLRRRVLTFKGMLWSAAAALGSMAAATGHTWAVTWVIKRLAPVPMVNGVGSTPDQTLYIWAMVSIALAVFGALMLWFRRRLSLPNLTAGGLFWWLLFSVLVAVGMPEGSYIFQFMLLLGLAGLVAQIYDRPFAALTLPLLGALLWVPILMILFVAIPFDMLFVVVLLLALFLVAQPLLLEAVVRLFRWIMPVLALAAALVLVSFGLVRILDHPRYNHISYWLDADKQTALYISTDDRLDDWTHQFFPSGAKESTLGEAWFVPGLSMIPALTGPAPVLPLAAPQVEVVQDQTEGNTRTATLRLHPTEKAYNTYFYVGDKTELLSGEVQGVKVEPAILKLTTGFVSYRAIPKEGLLLKLAVKAGSPVELLVTEQQLSWTVPSTPRPTTMLASPMTDLDRSMFITRRFAY